MVGWSLLFLSAFLAAIITVVFAVRPVSFSAVTVLPLWSWTLGGLVLSALARVFRPAGRKLFKLALPVVAALWLGMFFMLADEPRGLLRALTAEGISSDGPATGELRVVSLNCGGGSLVAAQEVAAWKPDLVLLQEIPEAKGVVELARAIFGEQGAAVVEANTAILCRSPAEGERQTGNNRRIIAVAHIPFGGQSDVLVGSIHLTVPPIDVSLWKPATWRVHRSAREEQREQLLSAARDLIEAAQDKPVILAGDFNAPQGDWLFKPLKPHLREAFREAGVGWGNTIENGLPVLRIDQVWLSRHLRATCVAAIQTKHSDHRMVVADLVWKR
jgi:vancomycin resistance protein VanJ